VDLIARDVRDPALVDESPDIGCGGSGQGRQAAAEKLAEMARSPLSSERVQAAQALGELEAGFTVQPLARLLEDPERLLVGLYPNTVAILNRYPYNNGHVLVAPRRHVANLWDLPSVGE